MDESCPAKQLILAANSFGKNLEAFIDEQKQLGFTNLHISLVLVRAVELLKLQCADEYELAKLIHDRDIDSQAVRFREETANA